MMKRILFAEDDPDDQYLILQCFNDIDNKIFDPVMTANGVEALETLNKSLPFDLIFLDLNMPLMNGFDTLRILNTYAHNVPVYILSTSSSEKDKKLCMELGAKGFITKPVGLDELCKELHHLCNDEFFNNKSVE